MRQLHDVLVELRNAGLVNWVRTRTNCVYSVHPDLRKPSDLKPDEQQRQDRRKTSDLKDGESLQDRQETASEICGKPPVTAAENRLQKRSIENHHQKRSLKMKSGVSESAAGGAAVISQMMPPDREAFDQLPQTLVQSLAG